MKTLETLTPYKIRPSPFSDLPELDEAVQACNFEGSLESALSHLTPPDAHEQLISRGRLYIVERLKDGFLRRRGRRELIAKPGSLFVACEAIERQLENPSATVREAAYSALDALFPTANALSDGVRCLKDMTRFNPKTSISKAYPCFTTAKIVACRLCGQTRGAVGVKEVVANFDRTQSFPFWWEGGTLHINCCRESRPFDFDRVDIQRCSDEEVIRFTIACKNNHRFFDEQKLAKLPCQISPSAGLLLSTQRILAGAFVVANLS